MGFFDSILKPFEQIGKQLERSFKDVTKEVGRIDDNLKKLRPKPPPAAESPPAAEAEPLPKPDPPIVQGQAGGGATDVERRFVRAGRRGTLLTGQLSPKKVGKKGLLG